MFNIAVIDAKKPLEYDVLLTDIKSETLHTKISESCKLHYLAITNTTYSNAVVGILYGDGYRFIIPLAVSFEKSADARTVYFIVDTGAPGTYLSEETLKAFNRESTSDSFHVYIHGAKHKVSLSTNHYSDVNILGTDFMSIRGIALVIGWQERKFTMQFSE